MGATARFVLRLSIAGSLAVLAALGSALVDGTITPAEMVAVASSGVGALAIYSGLGFAVPQVEPHIGNELEDE